MIVIVYEAECKVICCQHYTSIQQVFTEVEMNKIVLVYTTDTKKLFYFFQFTRKWSEIYLLTRDRVSPVARRLIVLAIHFRTRKSPRKALFTYVVCVNENYFAM